MKFTEIVLKGGSFYRQDLRTFLIKENRPLAGGEQGRGAESGGVPAAVAVAGEPEAREEIGEIEADLESYGIGLEMDGAGNFHGGRAAAEEGLVNGEFPRRGS